MNSGRTDTGVPSSFLLLIPFALSPVEAIFFLLQTTD